MVQIMLNWVSVVGVSSVYVPVGCVCTCAGVCVPRRGS